ncbi:MAG: DUF115 domain-containing protein [Gemmatimonadetes bacterium]|nr:DUF115 domain-containing protein [Gemmatimonadota bacterium]
MSAIAYAAKRAIPGPLYYFAKRERLLARRRYAQLRRAAYWYRSPKRWLTVRRMRQYRDRHRGQRCFIIGNGPSLKQTDLSLLRNEITFGLNRIYLLFDELGFATTYYVAINALVIEQCAREIAALPCPKFIGWKSRGHVRFAKDMMFLRSRAGNPRFFSDITRGIWEGATVTYAAMQVAYYMGFEQVILVGVDHSFATQGPPNRVVVSQGDDPNHFAPEYFGKGFRWQLPDLATSELAYRIARLTYQRAGREIVDATVGGKLNVFPKVEYRSLFT